MNQQELPSGQPSKASLSVFKRVLFSLIAVALALGLLEAGLALIGIQPESYLPDPYVGFESTSSLFVETRSTEGKVYLQTAKNRLQLFNDQKFPLIKEKGIIRIFSMGGSTTFGRPYKDDTSFNGWMRAYLGELAPDQKFEVINAGGVSYASYRVAKLMEELIQYAPDIFVIYTGHNEFLEERIYSKAPKVPRSLKGLTRLARNFRSASLIKKTVSPLTSAGKEDAKASRLLKGEVDALLDNSVGPNVYTRDKEAQARAMEHYRFNLLRMVDMAESVGAHVMLITPSDNLRDVTPFKSDFNEKLSLEQRKLWKQYYDQARQAYAEQNAELALQSIAAAEAIDALPASLHFVKGRIFEAIGKTDEAVKSYKRARDEDVCPLRALSPVQSILADVVSDTEVPLVDFVALQSRLSRNGIPGSAVFLDHVHPTIESHRLLALELLETMDRNNWINLKQEDLLVAKVTQSVMDGVDRAEHAFAMMNLAKVLGWAGKRQEAYVASKKSVELNSKSSNGQFQAGLAAFLADKLDEAMMHYRHALRLDPSHSDAHCNLGGLLEDNGEIESAVHHFEKALLHGGEHGRERNKQNLANALKKMDQKNPNSISN
ncbi:MAG: hypothetical protein HOM65_05600 [Verrucomicrobia bacterium]|nr:hypothetical protein [Verrucomicrobiota bacterium]